MSERTANRRATHVSARDRLSATLAALGRASGTGGRRALLWGRVEAVGCIVAGCVFLIVPNRAVASLAVVLGLAVLFVSGWLIAGVLGRTATVRRGRRLLSAAACFVAAVLVLAYPTIGAFALIVSLTAWLLATGIGDAAIAWTTRPHRGVNSVIGVVSIVAALSLVIPPIGVLTDGVLLVLTIVGLIVRGILELVRSRRRATG